MRGRRFRRGLLGAAILVAGGTRSHAAAEMGGTAIDVTAGNLISCAAQPSGRVVCWGFDVFARGDENKVGTPRPFPIAGMERAASPSATTAASARSTRTRTSAVSELS